MRKFLDIIKAEADTLASEFRLASVQGSGTSQEVADFRENAVNDLLGRFYPQSHIVTKGKITDLDGNQSNSIDCIILNPAHPNLTDSKGKFRLNFSDGCDAAIEVKADLARADELERGIKQGISVKSILRSKSTILLPRSKATHLVEHSLRIPFYLFCMKAFEIHDLTDRINTYYLTHGTPIEDQIDGICIFDVGILKNIKHPELNVYGAPPPIGGASGWYYEKWGEGTIVGLLLNLAYSFGSQPRLGEPILKRLLTRIGRFDVERIRVPS